MVVPHSKYHKSATVSIDQETCKVCGRCAEICPAEVLMVEDQQVRVRTDSPFGCIACGHCMMVCPEESITVRGRGISPEDLIPLSAPQEAADADALAALIQARRSVRHFRNREVDNELLTRVVELAASAPMGIPPWDVGCVIVGGREKVRDLAAEIVRGYGQMLTVIRPWVLALMRPFMGKASYDQFRQFIIPLAHSYIRAHRAGRDKLFWNAPAVLIFHHSPYAQTADAAIACTYAMLAAESLGLGSTIIGGAPPILKRDRTLCGRLGIPDRHTPSFALILGYPATHFRRAIRRHFVHVGRV